jgi:hypothetical protein
MMRQASRYNGYCSADCTLDDQELALRDFTKLILRRDDEVDWEHYEEIVEQILRGTYSKPYRPYTVFR